MHEIYIVFTLLALVVIRSLPFLKRYMRTWKLTQKFVGPKPLPLLGNANLFIGCKADEAFEIVKNMLLKYGETTKLWVGCDFSIFMSNTKDLETILGSTTWLVKAHEYRYLKNWLCEGLLLSPPTKWFQRRKILTPAFHFKILEQFVEVFERNSRIFVKNLSCSGRENESGAINLGDWTSLATLDVICEAAMGVSVNAQTSIDSEYVRAVKTISTVLHKRMFDILYRFEFTYRFTKLAREEKKALAILHGFTEKVIIQRREELLRAQQKATEQQQQTPSTDDVGSKRKMAFLDILLQSKIDGKPLSNLDIREEVDTFMFEGHDTTSSAITFCFYNLATNPQCQQKCVDEIIQLMGKDTKKPVTYETLNNLHYVELCIKETLRMFPSVPLIGRKVTEECEINGKIIPAGTNIGIAPLYMGNNEELFPECSTFKPERFEAGAACAAEKVSPYMYIPFSAGPRNCIGQKFAMLEIKTVLANVLRHYEIEFVGNREEELKLVAELILRTRDPLMFKIKPRVF